ncbi:MAG: CehA/McbA family metallohydrolase [Vicinamibacterales bacterium]
MHGRALLAIAVGILGIVAIAAEGDDARYSRPLHWKKERFSRVLALGYTDLGANGRGATEIRNLGGASCLVGPAIGFDVDNAYAFDVDERVEVAFSYVPEFTKAEAILVLFDKNGGDGRGLVEVVPERVGATGSATVQLERARLAGQGAQGVDLAIVGRQGPVALCDVTITRTGTTRAPVAFGQLRLEVRDAKTGRAVPARVGLYDETGRLPLPSDDAVPVRRFSDQIRRVWMNRRAFWPVESREAFYVGGSYAARVPAGTYDLVVSRGPEYRLHHQKVVVAPQEISQVQVRLNRYADLPARGWYSGDSHVHLRRDRVADAEVWTHIAAEDLHIAHLLEMGNIMGTYFKQPAWGKAGRYQKDDVALVSGQEDPRTVARGHTIHWNVDRHAHFERGAFFQYHHVFERTRRGGAITGYAHHGELFNGRRGLAIDVPFGLVDFIEVLQGGRIATETWYNLLNLGFRILPVAGADWPYFGPTLPGVERTFVKVDGPFTVDSWLAGFRQGRAYVTNGPFLELTVNGQPMGAEIRVARGATLEINASAHLNPDVDALDRIELVVLGDVVRREPADGQDRAQLRTTLTADRSFWLAVRAYGRQQETQFTTIAHSAPVYVLVGDEPTWKADALEALVTIQLGYLNDLLTEPVNADGDLEFFETRETILEEWKRQLPTLTPRVREAEARYRALLDRTRKPR